MVPPSYIVLDIDDTVRASKIPSRIVKAGAS